MGDEERVDRALKALRGATMRGFATESVGAARESPLPAPPELGDAERAALRDRIAELGPWRQGPFPLAPDLVAGPACGDDARWRDLAAALPDDLADGRVLDVGCEAGYDCFAFARHGVRHVLGCEWTAAIEQAALLEAVYSSGVSFEAVAWDALDPERHGTFELVHCQGVLQRVAAPMNLLGRLWRMTAPGGLLLIRSAVLDRPDLSRHIDFASAGEHRAEPAWVPGRLALRWMVETSGFDADSWFGESPHASHGGAASSAYLQARRSERAPATG
jgi:SAM-dependent methyltransferase